MTDDKGQNTKGFALLQPETLYQTNGF